MGSQMVGGKGYTEGQEKDERAGFPKSDLQDFGIKEKDDEK